jgi:hypothetical protein
MADNRKINQGVRVGKEVITDPDKLEEVITAETAKRLTESGAISGDWKPKGKAKKEEK